MSLNRQFRQASPAAPAVKEAKPVVASAAVKSDGAKRGPKPSGNAKILLTLRLDPAVIQRFKDTGPGWQARINDALKAAKLP
jgi:uncharacterized protein (DUF4415 family)